MLSETGAKGVNEGHRISSYSEVIHMHHNDNVLPRLWHNLMEHSLVNQTLSEAKVYEDLDKRLVPVMPGLFEPVQHLLQAEHCMAHAILVIAQGVMHKQDLIPSEFPIEVCYFDIKLLKLHV